MNIINRDYVWDSVRLLQQATSLSEVRDALRGYARTVGFEHFGFACKPRLTGGRINKFVALQDFPAPWSARYDDLASGRTSENDPLIRHITRIVMPSSWDRLGHVTFTDPVIEKSARQLLGFAGENGLRAGVTIPLVSPETAWCYLSLTTNTDLEAEELVPELPFALVLGQSLWIATQRINGSMKAGQPALSDREREILTWCSAGKSSWEISAILGISQATVNFHVGNASKKLRVVSRQAACARAIGLGLIHL